MLQLWLILLVFMVLFLPLLFLIALSVLGGGISVGITGLAAGFTIGISGQIGIISFAKQPELSVGLTLVLIFGEFWEYIEWLNQLFLTPEHTRVLE